MIIPLTEGNTDRIKKMLYHFLGGKCFMVVTVSSPSEARLTNVAIDQKLEGNDPIMAVGQEIVLTATGSMYHFRYGADSWLRISDNHIVIDCTSGGEITKMQIFIPTGDLTSSN